MGSSGDPNAATPALDSLAAAGVSCTNAISPYPVCTPARASLMTGQPSNLNLVERHGDFLDPSQRTVAHAFADAGYRTSYVGKWHLAPESGAHLVAAEGWAGQDFWVHPRLRGGFEDWYGFNISNNYDATYLSTPDKVAAVRLEGYQTDALTDLSMGYLTDLAAQGADVPWFHVVSFESPHPGAGGPPGSAGYPVPEPFASRFPPGEIALRPNVPAEHAAAARAQLAGYHRLIANLDWNVGRLLSRLDALGLTGSTIVVFTSDHGEMGGSHGLRNKQVPFEESLHVPLVFSWPGRLPAGTRYDDSVSLLDVAPTSLGLAGLAGLAGVRGLDHSAALAGTAGGWPHAPLRDGVLIQWNDTRFGFGDHPYRALRSPRHTLVVGRDDAFCLLFDRRTDPFELRNLFGRPGSADLQRALGARLLALLAEAGEDPPDYVAARLGRGSTNRGRGV